APIRDSQGQVTGIVGITRDITERILAEEALTQRVGQLELLNQVSRNLTAELSLDYLLSNAASLIQESFGYPHIGLFLVEHEQEELVMKARAGSYAAFFPLNHRLDLDEGITGWVARNGQRLLIGDVRRDPRYYNPFPEQLILSELSVPIKWRGEVVGVLDIQSDRLDAFDSNDVLVLETLADQLAAAIQNARLLIQTQLALVELMAAEAAEREQRALAEALVNVAAELNSTLDFEEVLEKILENVGYIAPYDSANIMLLENGIARVVHQKGRREDTEKFIWTVAETPTLSQMVKKNEPVTISDTQTDPIWVETIRWIRSYAGAPIRLNEEVIGFISLNGARPDMFTTEHARRLQAFANQTAIAIANARLYHELEVYSGILEQAVEERTAELQQTKERVETILNYSPDPILLLKPDGAIETANPAFKQVFGFHVDDLHRQLPTNLVIPDHANRVQAALQSAIDEHQVMRLELTARHQDGTTFDAEVALAPISENKNLLGIVCSVRDISALKEVERMKDAFVSNVSHELRTPITSLKLSHRLIEMDPENREEYMGRLSREVNRLNDLIEDLLRLSRLDQGRVELNLQPVDLNELAQQYVNDRSPLAESKELSLLFEGEKDVMPVQADEGLIGQVLSILLTNALNYTPAGGRVTVSTHMKEIDGKRWVGHSVSDTGPGITPDDQPHLFERFYRGKAGHDSGAPGTGLGLAIAHEIVDQHRGKIDVESEGVPGKGATFTVWLPFHM
ncbi:MAG: GAF domain-containing protein, partial [Anaerolineae bacterium]|nr:GAF domain-containing protein [Anaerolineae bacterium]